MVSTETQSILQRKAARGTQEYEARAMSVSKAMRLSIAKIGKDLFGLPISAIGALTEDCKGPDLSKLLEDGDLLCLLDGEDEKVGAAIIGPDIASGLIQQQTMGRVGPPSGDLRPMTQTDAAMCAPLLDALFKRVAPMLEVESEKQIITNFEFGARLEDGRALGMALDRPEYFIVRLTLDLAGGVRQGNLTLILPKCEPVPSQTYGPAQDNADPAKGPESNDLVMDLTAELNMVLCSLKLELTQVKHWSVGDVLRLPHDAFPETEIFTNAGLKIGAGTLGQVNGIRALRLKREPIYATQPRRREVDLPGLDLPEIKALPEKRSNPKPVQAKPDSDPLVIDSGADLPALKQPLSGSNAKTEGSLKRESEAAEKIKPLNVNNELPELDDFPDLANLPELSRAN